MDKLCVKCGSQDGHILTKWIAQRILSCIARNHKLETALFGKSFIFQDIATSEIWSKPPLSSCEFFLYLG